jgi:hypothetical protein
MESLPVILQAALLLLGLALSLYLWTIFTLVGVVMIFFTSAGVVFYVAIIICGTLWYDCPFQTPVSTFIHAFIHALIEHDKKHSQYIPAIYKGLHSIVEKCSSMITQVGSRFRRLVRADVEAAAPEDESEEQTEMQKNLTPLFPEENWNGHIADAQCILWMQETSTDAEVAIATTRFIPEVQWHSGIQVVATPLLDKLWNDFVSCYDQARLSGQMIGETRDKANVAVKALVHLYAQRRCTDHISVLEEHDLGPYIYYNPAFKFDEGDEMRSTLGFLYNIQKKQFHYFDGHVPRATIQHLAWLLHIILYSLMKDESVRNDIDIHAFIRNVLDRDHSQSILTDCLLGVGLTIDMPVHTNDLIVIDKRCDCVLNSPRNLIEENA